MKKIKGFKRRLFKTYMLIGLVPLMIMAVAYYFTGYEMVSKKINSSVNNNMSIMAELLDSTLTNLESMAVYISENEEIKNIMEKKSYESYDERFEDVQKVYKIINSFEVKKMDIPIYITGVNNPLSRFTTQPYFSEMYSSVNGYAFNIFENLIGDTSYYVHRRYDGRESKDIVLTIIRRIRNISTDEVIGYVFLDIYDEYFDDVFQKFNLGENSNILIMNKKGSMVTDKIYKDEIPVTYGSDEFEYIMTNEKGSFKFFNRSYMMYFDTLSHTGFKVINIVPYREIYGDVYVIIRVFIILFILMVIVSIAISFRFSNKISNPINELAGLMRKVEDGDLDVEFNYDCKDEIKMLGQSFNKMVRELERLIEEVYVKQYLLKEAELNSLKAQIDPHFLYNTLESIKWMAKLGDKDGVMKMTKSLGKLLRHNIGNDEATVTIKEEIEHIKNYLFIQKMRYRDKFTVEIHVDENIENLRILKLLIQPLVENSITHGFEKMRNGGKLKISLKEYEKHVYIEVIDNGREFEVKDRQDRKNKKGFGIGLSNVDRRIKLHYGEGFGINLERICDNTHATILLPKEVMEDDKSTDSR